MKTKGFRAATPPHVLTTFVMLFGNFGIAAAQAPATPNTDSLPGLQPLPMVSPSEPPPVTNHLGLQALAEVVPTAPTLRPDGTLGLEALPEVSPTIPGPAMPSGIIDLYPLVTFAPAAPEPRTPGGGIGTQAPEFSLQTPQGETVAFPPAAKGQPMVLLFWPSWCPYSRALQPYVQSIWEDYRDHGAQVWTINIEETRDPLAVMKERKLSFPVLLAGNTVADQFNVRLMPAVLVIDGNGKIVYVMHEKTISPVEAAKQIRTTLNDLLGDRAVALPSSYPAPYDLHLLSLEALNLRLTPPPLPQSEWEPWVDAYLATLKPGETLASFPPKGAIANGKQAISVARDIWSQKYGVEQTLIQAPYRSYRINSHWVVLGSGETGGGTQLGEGFIAVLEVDTGRVVRVVPRQ